MLNTGWGALANSNGRLELTCHYGTMTLQRLDVIDVGGTADGFDHPVRYAHDAATSHSDGVHIAAGQRALFTTAAG